MRRTLSLLLATLALSACADAVAPSPDAAFARGGRTGPTTTIQSLTAGINGPGTVGNYTTCTFTSTVSGGTAPYSYSWSIAGASGGYLSFTNASSATLQATGYNYGSYGSTGSVYLLLTVTDANSVTAYAPAKRVLIPYSSTSC